MIAVPNMGDSIKEGTVIEWVKNVGDSVYVDDVVVVLETDKVSVDVRTDTAGIVTQVFAEIDATVDVGADLFAIAEGEGGEPTPVEPVTADTTDDGVVPISPASVPSAPENHTARRPLIQFLGKRSLLAQPEPVLSGGVLPSPTVDPATGAIPFELVPALFRRLPVTDEEIEAVSSGGASMVDAW